MTGSDGEEDSAAGDEVYQPYASGAPGDGAQDDEGLLPPEDTLDGFIDPLDEGYSPPEKPRGVEHTGVTAAEQRRGESLDERLAEEIPDPPVLPDDDGLGDAPDTDGELIDDEVGDRRAGRLVAPDEGAHDDEEKDMIASDAGINGAAASAEEAAVHVVNDEDEYQDEYEDQ
ncbi:DUF5709 domain-containing protein [Streptomyces sp. CMB-StM0423]|uniref:DUF5709 domain-containing protein n=1 Tax=Streptomyces sp. CMB-StM0423 TaxID=2059884 RepID=UPI000C70A76E|nr:DUF5709 domain-containing protein [Streptomyces sp. CMB-StM0423]AUH39831.1 hypothetical protein CXR04_05845 [Streptomyces sp. CMB-StM0423]